MNPERTDKDLPSAPDSGKPSAAPTDSSPPSTSTPGEKPDTLAFPRDPAPVASTQFHSSDGANTVPRLSGQIADYEVVRELGQGASGAVYLARQVSLDRLVALKATVDSDTEALTLAQLEHPHIVQVFAEEVDAATGLRLLCMQFVPGMTLQALIDCLAGRDRTTLTGRDLLAILEEVSPLPDAVETHAMRHRDLLAGANYWEAVCWLAARLAEALAHAHRRGVLHRDIKPANVLLDHYGRPLLADFGLSSRTSVSSGIASGSGRFGGTLAYMAPEHLDAFNPASKTVPDDVDERSDIYSLGVLIYQLLTGELPFDAPIDSGSKTAILAKLAARRREQHVTLRKHLPDIPDALERTILRCLAPDSEVRYRNAEELAAAFEGCRELAGVERRLPTGGFILQAIERRPLVSILVISFIPHWLGTAAAAITGAVRLFPEMTSQQKMAFVAYAVAITLASYPLFLALVAWYLQPVIHAWRSFHGATTLSADEVVRARRRTVRLPVWAATVQAIGWAAMFGLTGLAVRFIIGHWAWNHFLYFLASFGLSALIAMSYSLLLIEFLCLRVMYPRLWPEVGAMRTTANTELAGVPTRLRLLQFAVGALPLLGAMLLVMAGSEGLTGYAYYTFRALAVVLILLAIFGFQFSASMVRLMRESLDVLCGPRP